MTCGYGHVGFRSGKVQSCGGIVLRRYVAVKYGVVEVGYGEVLWG